MWRTQHRNRGDTRRDTRGDTRPQTLQVPGSITACTPWALGAVSTKGFAWSIPTASILGCLGNLLSPTGPKEQQLGCITAASPAQCIKNATKASGKAQEPPCSKPCWARRDARSGTGVLGRGRRSPLLTKGTPATQTPTSPHLTGQQQSQGWTSPCGNCSYPRQGVGTG